MISQGVSTMERALSNSRRLYGGEQDDRTRMRENLLAGIITATLLVMGTCLTNELLEAGQSCYGLNGSCEAWGVPIDQIGFSDFFQQ
jgi:hypothetical protein